MHTYIYIHTYIHAHIQIQTCTHTYDTYDKIGESGTSANKLNVVHIDLHNPVLIQLNLSSGETSYYYINRR